MPGTEYLCCGGSFSLLELPSPKSHNHEVGDPVEDSVNVTVRGAVPLVGDPPNPAFTGTVVVLVGTGVVSVVAVVGTSTVI